MQRSKGLKFELHMLPISSKLDFYRSEQLRQLAPPFLTAASSPIQPRSFTQDSSFPGVEGGLKGIVGSET